MVVPLGARKSTPLCCVEAPGVGLGLGPKGLVTFGFWTGHVVGLANAVAPPPFAVCTAVTSFLNVCGFMTATASASSSNCLRPAGDPASPLRISSMQAARQARAVGSPGAWAMAKVSRSVPLGAAPGWSAGSARLLSSTRPGRSPEDGAIFQARAAPRSVPSSPLRRAGGRRPPSSKTLRLTSSHSESGQARETWNRPPPTTPTPVTVKHSLCASARSPRHWRGKVTLGGSRPAHRKPRPGPGSARARTVQDRRPLRDRRRARNFSRCQSAPHYRH